MTLQELKIKYTADISEAKKGLQDLNNTVKNTNRDVESSNSSMIASFGKLAAAGASLAVAFSFGKEAYRSYANFDALKTALTNVMGSAQAASAHIKVLKKASENPGLDFKQAVTGSLRLQNAGISADTAAKALKSFGNAIAMSGAENTADTLDRVTLALTQMANKGKVSAEEINQLTEAGISLQKYMKKIWGTSDSEQLQKMGVTGKEFVEKITDELSKIPSVSDNAKNGLDNLGAAYDEFKVVIGEAISPAITPFVKGVTELLSAFTKLPDWIKTSMVWVVGLGVPIAIIVKQASTYLLLWKRITSAINEATIAKSAHAVVPLNQKLASIDAILAGNPHLKDVLAKARDKEISDAAAGATGAAVAGGIGARIIGFFKGIGTKIASIFAGAWEAITAGGAATWGVLIAGVAAVISIFRDLWNWITGHSYSDAMKKSWGGWVGDKLSLTGLVADWMGRGTANAEMEESDAKLAKLQAKKKEKKAKLADNATEELNALKEFKNLKELDAAKSEAARKAIEAKQAYTAEMTKLEVIHKKGFDVTNRVKLAKEKLREATKEYNKELAQEAIETKATTQLLKLQLSFKSSLAIEKMKVLQPYTAGEIELSQAKQLALLESEITYRKSEKTLNDKLQKQLSDKIANDTYEVGLYRLAKETEAKKRQYILAERYALSDISISEKLASFAMLSKSSKDKMQPQTDFETTQIRAQLDLNQTLDMLADAFRNGEQTANRVRAAHAKYAQVMAEAQATRNEANAELAKKALEDKFDTQILQQRLKNTNQLIDNISKNLTDDAKRKLENESVFASDKLFNLKAFKLSEGTSLDSLKYQVDARESLLKYKRAEDERTKAVQAQIHERIKAYRSESDEYQNAINEQIEADYERRKSLIQFTSLADSWKNFVLEGARSQFVTPAFDRVDTSQDDIKLEEVRLAIEELKYQQDATNKYLSDIAKYTSNLAESY